MSLPPAFLDEVLVEPSTASTRLWVEPIGTDHPPPAQGSLQELAGGSVLDEEGWRPLRCDEDWHAAAVRASRCLAAAADGDLAPQSPSFAPKEVDAPRHVQLFVDGSCHRDTWSSSARAGWGVVGLVGRRQILRAWGPVPQGWPQSAPASEWAAALMSSKVWRPGMPSPVGDCQAVVGAMGRPVRSVLLGGGAYSGVLRALVAGIGTEMPMQKTKAHRRVEDAVDAKDAENIVGNGFADDVANIGAGQHPQPSKVEALTARARWKFVQDLAVGAAKIMSVWPSLGTFLGGRAVRANRVGTNPQEARKFLRQAVPKEHQHAFRQQGGTILCDKCLCTARTWRAARRRQAEEACTGVSLVLRQAMESQVLGHRLVLAIFEGRPTVCCISCGCYATSRLEGLARVCVPARPGSKGRQSVNRLRRGEHVDIKKRGVRGEAWYRVLGIELQEFTPGR